VLVVVAVVVAAVTVDGKGASIGVFAVPVAVPGVVVVVVVDADVPAVDARLFLQQQLNVSEASSAATCAHENENGDDAAVDAGGAAEDIESASSAALGERLSASPGQISAAASAIDDPTTPSSAAALPSPKKAADGA
jgi:hypothetical protein